MQDNDSTYDYAARVIVVHEFVVKFVFSLRSRLAVVANVHRQTPCIDAQRL